MKNINNPKTIFQALAPFENLEKTNQKISFCEKEIQVENEGKTEKHSYQNIQNFTFCFGGIAAFEMLETNWIRWEMKGKEYFHFINLDTAYKKEQFAGVLKYLYSENISLKEINEKGEELYLLRLPAPPEPPKEKKEKPVEDKYLKMIAEIGKETEKT